MDNRCPDFVFDNDISGIGVRIAIYVQNILVFFPVIWNLGDGYVSESELESIEKQSRAILVIAFAILIATIVQATSFGMSNFHAAVVLDLSWMNNICTFVWFLLYLHHQTKPTAAMPLTWRGCWKWVVKLRVKWQERRVSAGRTDIEMNAAEEKDPASEGGVKRLKAPDVPEHKAKRSPAVDSPEQQATTSKAQKKRTIPQFIIKHLVLILGSLHLSLMSAVGLWLWNDPVNFGGSRPECPVATVILGHSIPFTSQGLRQWSLLIYSVLLVPGLNLILPFLLFFVPHIAYNEMYHWHRTEEFMERWNDKAQKMGKVLSQFQCGRKVTNDLGFLNSGETHTGFTYLGFILLAIINAVFVVNIESTIHHNRPLQDANARTPDWGYGQILSLVLLVVPIMEVTSALVFVDPYDPNIYTELLRRAGGADELDFETINKCLNCHADPNVRLSESDDYTFLLHRAVEKDHGKVFDRLMLCDTLIFNIRDRHGSTALHVAVENSHVEMARQLLSRGADIEARQGSNGSRPIHIAVRSNHGPMLQLLLEKGADKNSNGGDDYTPLHDAAFWGRLEMVKLLVGQQVEVNRKDDGGNPLHDVASMAVEVADESPMNKRVDLNRQVPDTEQTALHMAARWGYHEIVQRLVTNGADTTIKDVLGRTALDTAIERGMADCEAILRQAEQDRGKSEAPQSQQEKEEAASVEASTNSPDDTAGTGQTDS